MSRSPLRVATFVATVATAYFVLIFYPTWRVTDLLLGTATPGRWVSLAIGVLPPAIWLLQQARPMAATRPLALVALTWMAIGFQLFLPVAFRDAVAAFTPLPERLSGFALLGLAVVLLIVGSLNAQRLRVRRIDLTLPELAGRSLVQISDIHLGSRGGAFLRRVVEQVRGLEPDHVVITGDLVDSRRIEVDALAALSGLEAPTYFVTGNHDRWVDVDDVVRQLRELDVHVLRDRSVVDGPIQFIGLDDAADRDAVRRGLQRVGASNGHVPILLYHRPQGFEDAAAAGVRLMLCGHTHWGQLIPFDLLVRLAFPRWRGLHRLGDATLYVSPGTGTWGPLLRLGSRNEITHFQFSGD